MASSYQAPVSAVQVGSYFVGQYYQVLKEHPDLAHQFYSESSSMIRIEGEESETASTMLEIHGFLTSLHLTTIEVKTINSLESWDGGILVVVSGLVKTKDFSGKRKFIQTFFLAPQEKGFFVLNDIFQFSDDGNVYQHPPSVMTDDKSKMQFSTSSPTPEPVSNYSLGEEASEYIRSVNIEDNSVNQYGQGNQVDAYYGQDNQADEYYGQENQVHEYNHDDLVDDLNLTYGHTEHQYHEEPREHVLENSYEENVSIPTQTVQAMPSAQDAANEPSEEPSKKTYASILQVARAHAQLAASAVPSQPSVNKATPVTSDWSYTPQPTAQQTNVKPSFEPEAVAETAEDSFFDDEGLLKSVYVRNLPSDVTEAEIADVFKHFGKIIPDGVAIKLRKEIGICYAFVEFEDFLGVHNAVKASPVQLAGRSIYVEERRANTTGGPRGGRRGGRGRGGYPTETGRGRFGSQSGRASSNYDGSSDYSRPRGNGSYTRGTR